MFCLSFRCEFRFEMFCLLMRTNECVGVGGLDVCSSATGFPLLFLFYAIRLVGCTTTHTRWETQRPNRTEPIQADPKTGLRSALIRFWEWQMHLRLGSEILSGLQLMGLNVMTINWFHDYGNSIRNLWMVIMQFEVI